MIHPGSAVYVVPTKDDFDRYLMAEIQKPKFPFILVTKHEDAEYEINVVYSSNKTDQFPSPIFSSVRASAETTISIRDVKSGRIVFIDTVRDRNAKQGTKSTAELCAKHLRKFMEKHQK